MFNEILRAFQYLEAIPELFSTTLQKSAPRNRVRGEYWGGWNLLGFPLHVVSTNLLKSCSDVSHQQQHHHNPLSIAFGNYYCVLMELKRADNHPSQHQRAGTKTPTPPIRSHDRSGVRNSGVCCLLVRCTRTNTTSHHQPPPLTRTYATTAYIYGGSVEQHNALCAQAPVVPGPDLCYVMALCVFTVREKMYSERPAVFFCVFLCRLIKEIIPAEDCHQQRRLINACKHGNKIMQIVGRF